MTVTELGPIYLYKSERKHWASVGRTQHILSFQLTGHYDHDFGDRILPVRAGSLFFINRADAYRVTRRSAGEAICVNLGIEDPPPTGVYDCAGDARVENLSRRLYALRHTEVEETRLSALAAVYELLAILAARTAPAYMPSEAAARLLPAERYINAHFRDGRITVADLAAATGLGEKQFTALFARHYRTTPAQYVIDLRLRTAAILLREGLSVGAAAAAVGIGDVYYFSKLFKRRFAVAPSQYAKGEVGP